MEGRALSELSAPRLVAEARAHRGEVACADAAGARLLTGGGGGDRALRLWRWRPPLGWQLHAEARRAHRYGVTVARWSEGGAVAASGGVDGAVRLWGGRALEPRGALVAPAAAAVRALAWARGRLLAGHDDGAVCAWHAARGLLLARLHAHDGALHALAAPARAALLLAGCTNGVLKVYDLQEVLRVAKDGDDAPAPLEWVDGAHDMGLLCADADEGAAAATGGHDARVRVWRAERAAGAWRVRAGRSLAGHAAAVVALRWAGALLASASLDRTARLWAALGDGACLCVLHAHARYLTCVVLAPDLRYLITGSNDRTVRTWSLDSLTLDDELEPPCVAQAHFGIGDLEGISPLVDDDTLAADAAGAGCAGREWDVRCEYRVAAHAGAVNCIAVAGDLLATASSDGSVRVFRWDEAARALQPAGAGRLAGAGALPTLTAQFAAGGALLVTAGLDATAHLYDVQSGAKVRVFGGARREGEGGGGVRAGAVSAGGEGPALLLLATDDGDAPLWNLADPDPLPLHVYSGHEGGALCCAWGAAGVAAATGGASGDLRLWAPPPREALLFCQSDAHDLGVQCCEFAPPAAGLAGMVGEAGEAGLVLATGGCDALVKLWLISIERTEGITLEATMSLARSVSAHGGGVVWSVRWGQAGGAGGAGGALLASGGADRWARVWRVRAGYAGLLVTAHCAVPAGDAGGAISTALLDGGLLALGTIGGELSLWRLPERLEEEREGRQEGALEGVPEGAPEEGEWEDARWWGAEGVERWLREYVTRTPERAAPRAVEEALERRARAAALTGARLLDDPLEDLLPVFQFERSEECVESSEWGERAAEELRWLRSEPPPPGTEWSAPHALLCPLSHRVLREPARAPDGCTYERAPLLQWLTTGAASGSEEAVSWVSGRRMRSARVEPNHGARALLRAFLAQHCDAAAADAAAQDGGDEDGVDAPAPEDASSEDMVVAPLIDLQ